jgi:hypothetical protein
MALLSVALALSAAGFFLLLPRITDGKHTA